MEEGEFFAEDEAEKEFCPGAVAGEGVVKRGGGFFYAREFVPGDGGKIVVFVVVADVERDVVENAVVAVGFLLSVCEKMFLYPAGAEGVEPNGEKETIEEVEGGFGAEEPGDGGDKGDLDGGVEDDPTVEGFYFFQAGEAEQLEEGIEE